MTTTIEAPFTLRDTEREYIEQKISSLQKFEARMTQVNVYFKKDDGKVPNGILAEIRVRVPGKDVFADSTNGDAMKAFTETYNVIKRQVKKRRDQLNNHQSEVKEINEIVNNTY